MEADPLDRIRVKIDEIDAKLLDLLTERAELVHEVGTIKLRDGREIYAPEREEKLLQRLVKENRGRLMETSIRAIYREIMSAALALEVDLKIAFLGPDGTWTHQAAIQKFGNSVKYLAVGSLADVFDQVERKTAGYGVVPIENSNEGAVKHTLDLFATSPLRICAQIYLPIETHLLAKIPREAIRRIYSNPQVFGQCRKWLGESFSQVQTVEVASTPEAADRARQDPNGAVLGGSLLAELFGLELLEEKIQDSPREYNRYLVIAHRSCPPTGNDRTSVMFSVRDQPGALFSALQPFQTFEINLLKIESRPNLTTRQGHSFYVDVAAHGNDESLQQAMTELKRHCTFVKLLGSYPEVDRP